MSANLVTLLVSHGERPISCTQHYPNYSRVILVRTDQIHGIDILVSHVLYVRYI